MDVVFQRDNAFVDAASEQLTDVVSRQVKAAAPASTAQKSTARPVLVSGDISEFDIFVSAHDYPVVRRRGPRATGLPES